MPSVLLNKDLARLSADLPRQGLVGYRVLAPVLDKLITAAQIQVSVDKMDIEAIPHGFHIKPQSGFFGAAGTPPVLSAINQDIISDPYEIDQIITFWPVGSFFDETDPDTHFQWFLNGIAQLAETAFTFTWEITSGTVGTKDVDDQAFPSVAVVVCNREGIGGKAITLHVDTTI